MQRCCRSDCSNFSTNLPCFLLKGPLKHDLLDIYLIMFFRAGNSGNTSAKRVIFFCKRFKFNIDFANAEKN